VTRVLAGYNRKNSLIPSRGKRFLSLSSTAASQVSGPIQPPISRGTGGFG